MIATLSNLCLQKRGEGVRGLAGEGGWGERQGLDRFFLLSQSGELENFAYSEKGKTD